MRVFLQIYLCVDSTFTSKVSFDYNSLAYYSRIGMVCSVKDREKGSFLTIQHGAIEKVTMKSGCVIKSNDTRLSIACIETEIDVMLTVNLRYPLSSDLGTWNCSDGKSYDTVTFPDFVRFAAVKWRFRQISSSCIIQEECNLLLPLGLIDFFSPKTFLRTIDGKELLMFRHLEQVEILDREWSRRIIINGNTTYRYYDYLNVTLQDVDISDAGIYYFTGDGPSMGSSGFIIKITDYPKQPAILLRSHEAESKLGPYELYCASESTSQPTFTRKQLSFTWRLNGHNLTELQPCFRLSGAVLTLCMDACGLETNDNISVTCTAEEDGLESNESQPFIVPVSRVISAVSARDVDNQEHQAVQAIGTLVGACLGSFIIGVILSSTLKLLVTKRDEFCKKEHRDEERNTDVPDDAPYVNSIMMIHTRPTGEVPFRNTVVNRIDTEWDKNSISGQEDNYHFYEVVV